MKRINEIFYSLQGEGRNAGTPAIFVRFSGCNLKCSFCDTKHEQGIMMTDEEILRNIERYPSKFVVLTGGEPSLQSDPVFIEKLHQFGYHVAIETNGTRYLPDSIDWVTLSPKDFDNLRIREANEVKFVVDESIKDGTLHFLNEHIKADYYYIQPCDTKDEYRNKKIIELCIEFVKANPIWKLSTQQQKMLNLR